MMDVWFTLFVSLIALVAAGGVSLLMVGYLSVMPVSLGQGRLWLWSIGIGPAVVVAVPVVTVTVLDAFGVSTVQSTALAGWLAGPAFAVHLLALMVFVFRFRETYAKAGKQLLAGVILMALAVAGLYGLGPGFAERAVALAKEKPAAVESGKP